MLYILGLVVKFHCSTMHIPGLSTAQTHLGGRTRGVSRQASEAAHPGNNNGLRCNRNWNSIGHRTYQMALECFRTSLTYHEYICSDTAKKNRIWAPIWYNLNRQKKSSLSSLSFTWRYMISVYLTFKFKPMTDIILYMLTKEFVG